MKRPLTRNQERVLQILQTIEGEISAQSLYIKLREAGLGMGLATVYRALDTLKLGGAVQVRMLGSGEALYSFIKKDRHHLNCIQCGRSQPIHECPVQELANRLSEEHQFRVFYHTLEFYGLCDGCAAEGLMDQGAAPGAVQMAESADRAGDSREPIERHNLDCQCHPATVTD